MKVSKVIVGIVLSILLSTLLLAGTSMALQKIVYCVDGSYSRPGTPEEGIAELQAEIEDPELLMDTLGVKTNELKIELLTLISEKMAAAGYSLEGQDWGWAEQLTQKETVAFLSGIGPDVIIGETQMPGFAAQGYLEPFPEALAEKVRETVVPGAYLPMTVGGKIYGLAPYPGVNVLFWNKDLFRKAGLDPEVGPKTWSEWLDMSNKITAAGKGKFYGGGVFVGPHFGGSLRVGPFMMMTAGGGFVDENNDIQFAHPGNIKALEFIRKLNKNTPPGIAAAPSEGGFWDAYHEGRMGFVVDGPWRQPEAEKVGIPTGYSPLPLPDVGGRAANVTIGAAFYSVPTYSKNKEGAFKLIETLIDQEVQAISLPLMKRSCVLMSWGDKPANQESYYYTFWLALQGQVVGLPTYKSQSAKVWDIFHQNMTKAIVTDLPIDEIMAEAERRAKALQ